MRGQVMGFMRHAPPGSLALAGQEVPDPFDPFFQQAAKQAGDDAGGQQALERAKGRRWNTPQQSATGLTPLPRACTKVQLSESLTSTTLSAHRDREGTWQLRTGLAP
jgi:hypothetical protein